MVALLLAALSAVPVSSPPPLDPAFVAVIDPGHGGDKDGAIGPGGVREKNLAMGIARRLAQRLRAQGGKVILTRERDESVDLSARSALASAERK